MQAYGTGICTQPFPSLFCKLFNTTFMQDSPACESCRPPSSRYPSVLGSPWPVLPFSSVRFLLPLAFSSVHSPLHIFVFPCPALSVLSFSRSYLLSGLGSSFGYRTVTCRPWHPTLSVLSLLAWSSPYFLYPMSQLFFLCKFSACVIWQVLVACSLSLHKINSSLPHFLLLRKWGIP